MFQENKYRFLPQSVYGCREAVTPKLTQISRISEKSLLCNVSMNTCLDAQASWVGSAISTGTLPLHCATQLTVIQKIQGKNHIYTADIRNIMGVPDYSLWEVSVI